MSKTIRGWHAGFLDKKSVKSDLEMSGKQLLLLIWDYICSALYPDLWCQSLLKKVFAIFQEKKVLFWLEIRPIFLVRFSVFAVCSIVYRVDVQFLGDAKP